MTERVLSQVQVAEVGILRRVYGVTLVHSACSKVLTHDFALILAYDFT